MNLFIETVRDRNLFSSSFPFFQVLKWNFTAPRAEFVEQLKEQMRPCFGKTLHTNLFHADFKYHLIGISTMQQVLERHSVTRHQGNSSLWQRFDPVFSPVPRACVFAMKNRPKPNHSPRFTQFVEQNLVTTSAQII